MEDFFHFGKFQSEVETVEYFSTPLETTYPYILLIKGLSWFPVDQELKVWLFTCNMSVFS